MREQHLPAVAEHKITGEPVERPTEVIIVAQLSRAGVERHADSQGTDVAPVGCVERSLCGQASGQRIGSLMECHSHARNQAPAE